MDSNIVRPGTRAEAGRRGRTTSSRVVWMDRLAAFAITLGGMSVILAVLGILIYLLMVVWPLFAGAAMTRRAAYPLLSPEQAADLLFADVDEYRTLGLCALASGKLVIFEAVGGRTIEERTLFPSQPRLTAVSRSQHEGHTAFGFSDGTVRLARIGFEAVFDPAGRREVRPSIWIGQPTVVGAEAVGVALLDYRPGGGQVRLATLKRDGALLHGEVRQREDLVSGEVTVEITTTPLPAPAELGLLGLPSFLQLTSQGDQIFMAWSDGTALRYDLRDPSHLLQAERVGLTASSGSTLTAFQLMLGEQSLLAADSRGGTRAWFLVPHPDGQGDSRALVPAHTLTSHAAAVRALGLPQRGRSILTGAADGSLMLHHMTSERMLATAMVDPPSPILAIQITPKQDGVFALSADGRATLWDLFNHHPETTLAGLFGKVWYEGYAEPGFTWQSSSGTDDSEPKLSLVPLIFGTLKATLYSMLFAVPIALCAAIYTSEFLHRRYRTSLKSTIEMMASLPSVVLGFIAALVLAPIFESWAVAVLAGLALVPLVALSFGYVWQLLPARIALTLSGRSGGGQLGLLLILVLASLAAASILAEPLETILFQGDFKAWLDGRAGTGAPGIGVLCWPLILITLLVLDRAWLAQAISRRRSGGAVVAELTRYLILIALSFALAWIVALAGAQMGFDPRGAVLGTYVQRNVLVVGFVMGFAVIPIIYTIAEDALSTVPEALRSASLGCGATRWQTAARVVLPVALPGIFSAIMIGLGRAIGETMIVLMAAGNTPLLSLNIFDGLRTLSANIAVELPEAAKDGTLYRTLFLAALMLFLITFAINSIAEVIRQRFRRRAYQL